MKRTCSQLTILFADIGGSVALYKRVGDAKGYELITLSLARMKAAVEGRAGTVLRTVGDAVLASFDNPDAAFLGARDIQLSHQELPLSVRVGFHSGAVICDDGDVYGHAVNLAARVAEFARVDEIVATEAAVSQLSAANQVYVTDGDTLEVRGVSEAIGIHRLLWQGSEAAMTQLASEQVRKITEMPDVRLRISVADRQLYAGPDCPDVRLGRSDDNQIAVNSQQASRYHAEIQYRHGQFVLHDLSTNGTYVQKSDLMPFLVRRDSIVLDGHGFICLGASPAVPGAETIEFELVSVSAE